MIIYDLRCERDHSFEGWFRSPDDFASQQARSLVSCPQCQSHQVRRVPSAVAIAAQGAVAERSSSSSKNPHQPAMPTMPEVRAIYRQLYHAIVAQSEDVGSRFADEARKIHYHEAPERLIRGQATAQESADLQDEGINILSLPAPADDEFN